MDCETPVDLQYKPYRKVIFLLQLYCARGYKRVNQAVDVLAINLTSYFTMKCSIVTVHDIFCNDIVSNYSLWHHAINTCLWIGWNLQSCFEHLFDAMSHPMELWDWYFKTLVTRKLSNYHSTGGCITKMLLAKYFLCTIWFLISFFLQVCISIISAIIILLNPFAIKFLEWVVCVREYQYLVYNLR